MRGEGNRCQQACFFVAPSAFFFRAPPARFLSPECCTPAPRPPAYCPAPPFFRKVTR